MVDLTTTASVAAAGGDCFSSAVNVHRMLIWRSSDLTEERPDRGEPLMLNIITNLKTTLFA